MWPIIAGYPSFWILWGAAIVAGFIGALLSARRHGYGTASAAVLILCVAVVFVLGTKLHWWWKHPEDLRSGAGFLALLLRGFHFPGGIVLSALVLPLLFRLSGHSLAAFLDVIAPVAALSIALARIGCFLSGCCFGTVCDLPWGVRFPPGSRAYQHHVDSGRLPADHLGTLPLHPTQLYFALAALVIALLLARMQSRPHRDGDVALWLVALWGWSDVVIEAFRDHSVLGTAPYLWLTGAVVAITASAALIVRRHLDGRQERAAP